MTLHLTPTPLDRAVWAACPYIRNWRDVAENRQKKCEKCPAYEMDPKYGRVISGCRAVVEEILVPALKAYHEE